MASNLDYLAPALEPLEEKVKAYLRAEEALRKAHQTAGKPRLALQALHDELGRLRQEVLELLPVRNAWVKVNLGYGPSRVGAWEVPGPPAHHELRVVH